MRLHNLSYVSADESSAWDAQVLLFPIPDGVAWVGPDFELSPSHEAHYFKGDLLVMNDGRRFLQRENGDTFTFRLSPDNLDVSEQKAREYLLSFFPELEPLIKE